VYSTVDSGLTYTFTVIRYGTASVKQAYELMALYRKAEMYAVRVGKLLINHNRNNVINRRDRRTDGQTDTGRLFYALHCGVDASGVKWMCVKYFRMYCIVRLPVAIPLEMKALVQIFCLLS